MRWLRPSAHRTATSFAVIAHFCLLCDVPVLAAASPAQHATCDLRGAPIVVLSKEPMSNEFRISSVEDGPHPPSSRVASLSHRRDLMLRRRLLPQDHEEDLPEGSVQDRRVTEWVPLSSANPNRLPSPPIDGGPPHDTFPPGDPSAGQDSQRIGDAPKPALVQLLHVRECGCFDDLETVYCPLTSDQCVRSVRHGGTITSLFFQSLSQQLEHPICIATPPSSSSAKIIFYISIICLGSVLVSIVANEYFGWSLWHFFMSQCVSGYNEGVADRILRDHPQRARRFLRSHYSTHQGTGIMALYISAITNAGSDTRGDDGDGDDEDHRGGSPEDRSSSMPCWWPWRWRLPMVPQRPTTHGFSFFARTKNGNYGPPTSLLLRTKVHYQTMFVHVLGCGSGSLVGDAGDSLTQNNDCCPNTHDQDDWIICAICLGTVHHGDRIGALPCNHAYHVECLKPWLKRRNVCPLCKRAEIATPRHGYGTFGGNRR